MLQLDYIEAGAVLPHVDAARLALQLDEHFERYPLVDGYRFEEMRVQVDAGLPQDEAALTVVREPHLGRLLGIQFDVPFRGWHHGALRAGRSELAQAEYAVAGRRARPSIDTVGHARGSQGLTVDAIAPGRVRLAEHARGGRRCRRCRASCSRGPRSRGRPSRRCRCTEPTPPFHWWHR